MDKNGDAFETYMISYDIVSNCRIIVSNCDFSSIAISHFFLLVTMSRLHSRDKNALKNFTTLFLKVPVNCEPETEVFLYRLSLFLT